MNPLITYSEYLNSDRAEVLEKLDSPQVMINFLAGRDKYDVILFLPMIVWIAKQKKWRVIYTPEPNLHQVGLEIMGEDEIRYFYLDTTGHHYGLNYKTLYDLCYTWAKRVFKDSDKALTWITPFKDSLNNL